MTSPNVADGAAKRRGRPRLSAQERQRAEEPILETACRLFAMQGYAKTTFAQIARELGRDPSSLYHYFKSKEDLLERVFRTDQHVRCVEEIVSSERPVLQRIAELIIHDAAAKCELPFDFIEFEELAKGNPERFAGLLDLYRHVYQAFVTLIEQGNAEGILMGRDPAESTVAILSIVDGLQHHYHAKRRGELILEYAGYEVRNLSEEEVGALAARSCIAMLLQNRALFEPSLLAAQERYSAMRARLADEESQARSETDRPIGGGA